MFLKKLLKPELLINSIILGHLNESNMKKLSFLAMALLIMSLSACQKDAIVAPSKSVVKKAEIKNAAEDQKPLRALDGNPAL